jgi:hypothetical protein
MVDVQRVMPVVVTCAFVVDHEPESSTSCAVESTSYFAHVLYKH